MQIFPVSHQQHRRYDTIHTPPVRRQTWVRSALTFRKGDSASTLPSEKSPQWMGSQKKWQSKARQGKARQGEARQGMARAAIRSVSASPASQSLLVAAASFGGA
ncbi:unnamed protein product [Laminaria digitata]